jgi:hypothetical protein
MVTLQRRTLVKGMETSSTAGSKREHAILKAFLLIL